jgi:hypothetical protein
MKSNGSFAAGRRKRNSIAQDADSIVTIPRCQFLLQGIDEELFDDGHALGVKEFRTAVFAFVDDDELTRAMNGFIAAL